MTMRKLLEEPLRTHFSLNQKELDILGIKHAGE